eukprot:TRINITY_DN58455_c0_g1_i1.p1 TRINITY_DN58455_c0_g1~~TRINITY_DN58455_c0_g1_i1.p1  ORF type:complete len:342 (+),score=99.59 TRINITY_DN58455_c0_g1_i1:90-1115(+)
MPERTRIDTSKYRRVKEPKEERLENEIVVNKSDDRATLIRQGIKLLSEEGGKKTIVVKAQGTVISNAIVVAEIIKRRVKGLHQDTKVGTVTLVDRYEPIAEPKEGEEKLEEKTVERSVIQMVIILSSDELDKDAIGYQAPLEDSEVDVNGSLDAFDDKKKQQKARTALPTNVRGRGAGAYLGRRGGRGGAAVSTELSGRGGKQGKGTKGSSKAANWNTSSNYRGGKGGSSYNRRENYYSQQPDYYNGAAAYYSSYPRYQGGYSSYGASRSGYQPRTNYSSSQYYSGSSRSYRDSGYNSGYGAAGYSAGYSSGGKGYGGGGGGGASRYPQDNRYYNNGYYRY